MRGGQKAKFVELRGLARNPKMASTEAALRLRSGFGVLQLDLGNVDVHAQFGQLGASNL